MNEAYALEYEKRFMKKKSRKIKGKGKKTNKQNNMQMRESTTMAFSKDGTKEVRKEWEGGKKYTIEKIICSKVGHGYWYTLLAWNEDYKMVYELMSAH